MVAIDSFVLRSNLAILFVMSRFRSQFALRGCMLNRSCIAHFDQRIHLEYGCQSYQLLLSLLFVLFDDLLCQTIDRVLDGIFSRISHFSLSILPGLWVEITLFEREMRSTSQVNTSSDPVFGISTYGPAPLVPFPCSEASFLFLKAMRRSLRAAVVAARLVSMAGAVNRCTEQRVLNSCTAKELTQSADRPWES